MAYSGTLAQSMTAGGSSLSDSTTYSGDALEKRQLSIPDSTTDQLVTIAVDVSTITAMFITSDYAVTIETNNAGAPDDTLTLVANKPYIWNTDSYFTNVFDTDITAMYITNASGATATVDICILFDSTP